MSENVEIEISAGGIVYRKRPGTLMWLVIQHSKAKHWGFPKGHIGDKVANEKIEEAALREVLEEGGISAQIISHDPIEIHYSYSLHGTTRNKTVSYYLMEYVSGDPEDHDWEVQEAKFVSENELNQILTYQADKDAYAQAKQTLKEIQGK